MFLVLKSYAYQAPLSDPVFGCEIDPEPKRKENHGIYMFWIIKSYTFLAPLSDLIFGSVIMNTILLSPLKLRGE